MRCACCIDCARQATRPSSWAAACATCCWEFRPKDFDIATSALPEEVRRVFRNCRLIGRRFRLAHVFFGRDIIEVATFRAMSAPEPGDEVPEPAADLDDDLDDELLDDDEDEEEVDESVILAEAGPHQTGFHGGPPIAERDRSRHAGAGNDDDEDRVTDEHGRILRDNVYGNIDDDVWRRDFTANSLYYNIADFSIWDYTGGVDDIAARRLKLIGDPVTRYREDPVRMLRAARFEAKLGFTLDGETGNAIAGLRDLLGSVPPARLFDETLKLFLTGHGARSLEVLQRARPARRVAADRGELPAAPSGRRRGAPVEAGPDQHRPARGAGQAGDADVPVRAAAVRADRRDHREAAAGEVARHRHHCRCRGSRGARRAGPHHASRSVSRWACAKCSPRSRGSSSRAAGAHCACWSSRASAPASTCCCCAPTWAWPPRDIADWWTRVQEVSQTDRDRMADALGVQRPAGEGGRTTAAAPPSPPWARACARRFMSAAAEALARAAAALRWHRPTSASAAISSEPRAQVERAFEALAGCRDSRLVAAFTAVSHAAVR